LKSSFKVCAFGTNTAILGRRKQRGRNREHRSLAVSSKLPIAPTVKVEQGETKADHPSG